MESDRIQASFNCLQLQTTRCLRSLIVNDKYTIIEIRELFRNIQGISREELESVETVEQLWEFLAEEKEVIRTDNVRELKIIAKQGLHSEELERIVDEYEHEIAGMTKSSIKTKLAIKIVLPVAFAGIVTTVVVYFGNDEIRQLVLERVVLPPLVKLVGVHVGSVCFVVETSSLSALKQLRTSYKDGSLRENFKKVINEIDEVRKLSNGTEIDMTVEIDEKQYREACWVLVLAQIEKAEVEQESTKSVHRPRRHSLSCERDLATCEKPHRSWQDYETSRRKYAEKQVEKSRKGIEMLKSDRDPGISKQEDTSIERRLFMEDRRRRIYAEIGVEELREEIEILESVRYYGMSKKKDTSIERLMLMEKRRRMYTEMEVEELREKIEMIKIVQYPGISKKEDTSIERRMRIVVDTIKWRMLIEERRKITFAEIEVEELREEIEILKSVQDTGISKKKDTSIERLMHINERERGRRRRRRIMYTDREFEREREEVLRSVRDPDISEMEEISVKRKMLMMETTTFPEESRALKKYKEMLETLIEARGRKMHAVEKLREGRETPKIVLDTGKSK